MRLLISTWGNPGGWKEVRYRYDDEEEKAPASSRLIRRKLKIDVNRSIIISTDTISDERIDCKKPHSYQEIKELACSVIRDFCRKELKEEPDVIISYGVGEFNKSRFRGNSMDFYFHVFKELSFKIIEWLNASESSELEVFLDISHGINFMPVLTYRALKEILQILGYKYDVRLTVLNCDPFIGRANPSYLNINEIEKTNILARLVAYRISRHRLMAPYFGLSEEEKRRFGEESGKFSLDEDILLFLSAFMYALPVFVITYLPNQKSLKDEIHRVLEKFEENIQIRQADKYQIERKLEFNANFENLLKAYVSSWMLCKLGFRRKQEMRLQEILEIKDKVWKKRFPVESERIDVEIESIKNLTHLTSNWETYSSLKSQLTGAKICGQGGEVKISKRNFFAHAGFEYNSIEIRKVGDDEIEVRMKSSSEDKIRSLLKNSLPKMEEDKKVAKDG